MSDRRPRRPAIGLEDRGRAADGDRRRFLVDLAQATGAVMLAPALFAGFAAAPARAAPIAADDPRLKTATVRQRVGPGRVLTQYLALPAKAHGPQPAVLVVHDDQGLTEATRALARRVALAGYVACAPDLLTRAGGTPADAGRARAMIAALDLRQAVLDAVAATQWLGRNPPGDRVLTGRVAALGYGWGGALVDQLAAAAGNALLAGVSYYGPAPDLALATEVRAAMLLHYAALDGRVTPGGLRWAAALRAAGVEVESFTYPGADHGFTDSGPGDVDAVTSALAWERTQAFLHTHLRPDRHAPRQD